MIAAAAVTLALQQIVARRMPPQEPVVIGVSSIEAASAATVIPDKALLRGTIRYANPALRAEIAQLIRDIAQPPLWRTTARLRLRWRIFITPPSITPKRPPKRALRSRRLGAAGECNHPRPHHGLGRLQLLIAAGPGFALIAPTSVGCHPPCHNAAYDFNDINFCCYERLCALAA